MTREQEIEEQVAREIEEDLANGRTFRTSYPPPPVTELRPVNPRTVYVDGLPKTLWDLQAVQV